MRFKSKLLPCVSMLAVLCLSATAVCAKEIQLGGIRLGSSALTVIQKYGNPTEVRVGTATHVDTSIQMPTLAGPAGAPMPQASGIPSMPPPPGGAPIMPPPPGGGAPGMMPPGMMPPGAGPATSAIQTQVVSAPEVTWVYRFPQNRRLEFILSPDGRVLQIAAFGSEWSGIGTSKGIRLGHTYKDVMLKYGYPEAHERSGMELVARYPEKHRALFTFVGRSLVGITIALMD